MSSTSRADFLTCSESLRTQRWEEIVRMKPSPLVRCSSLSSAPQQVRQIFDRPQDIVSAFVVAEKLSDCLQISPLRLLPKFSNESGLVSQIQNRKGKDTGLGQLTGSGIREVQREWRRQWRFIESSPRPSCQYVREEIEKVGEQKFFVFPVNQRCQLMHSDEGAVRNMIFSLILHRINRAQVDYFYRVEGISDLLRNFPKGPQFESNLKEVLVMLSYNSGAKTAVIHLKTYLQSRNDFTQKKRAQLGDSPRLSREQILSLRRLSVQDFNFSTGFEDYQKLLQGLPKNSQGRVSLDTLRQVPTSEMSFPVWLQVWQSAGTPGYLNHLSRESQRIERLFGVNCVDQKFYQP